MWGADGGKFFSGAGSGGKPVDIYAVALTRELGFGPINRIPKAALV
jgi:hypothetical protein